MRAVIQRVQRASVTIDGVETASIGQGYLILLGVGHDDTPATAEKLWHKIAALRIMEDENGKTNRSAWRCGRRGARGVAVHALCRLPARQTALVYGGGRS